MGNTKGEEVMIIKEQKELPVDSKPKLTNEFKKLFLVHQLEVLSQIRMEPVGKVSNKIWRRDYNHLTSGFEWMLNKINEKFGCMSFLKKTDVKDEKTTLGALAFSMDCNYLLYLITDGNLTEWYENECEIKKTAIAILEKDYQFDYQVSAKWDIGMLMTVLTHEVESN